MLVEMLLCDQHFAAHWTPLKLQSLMCSHLKYMNWHHTHYCFLVIHHWYMHCAKKPVTTMLTYPWKCTVLHCNHLGNTWKPLVLMTRHFDYCWLFCTVMADVRQHNAPVQVVPIVITGVNCSSMINSFLGYYTHLSQSGFFRDKFYDYYTSHMCLR